jgi:hypothetical protein
MSDEMRKVIAKACGAVAGLLVAKQVRKSVEGTAGTLLALLAAPVATAAVTVAVDDFLAKQERGYA